MDMRNWGTLRNPLLRQFFGSKFRLENVLANGAIGNNLLVELNASGLYTVGSNQSSSVVGVNNGVGVANAKPLDVDFGLVKVKTGAPIPYKGMKLKSITGGLAAPIIVTQANMVVATPGNFGNQPANDGIEIVSDNAADTMDVTVFGTTHGGVVVSSEIITLDGTDAVASVKVNWGLILAVIVSAAHAGTITVREASADATITTLAAGTNSVGVDEVLAADQPAYGSIPTMVAGGASTKVVGIEYVSPSGVTTYEAKALNGATAVAFSAIASKVLRVFGGDVATGTVVTVKTAAAETSVTAVGIAMETAAAEGELATAYIKPGV